jgi:hypothetical protein
MQDTITKSDCLEVMMFLLFQGIKVHATCCDETPGEHADALGTDPRHESLISHHWGYHIRQ